MSLHNSRNLERATRNSTKGRSASTGPCLTTSHPSSTHLQVSASLTQAHNEPLPANENNNNRYPPEENIVLESDAHAPAKKVKQPDKLLETTTLSQYPMVRGKLPVKGDSGPISDNTPDEPGDNTNTIEPPRAGLQIHADLQKELREGVPLLYKVSKAASKLNQYKSAKVVNYQLELDGHTFMPSQLETLPYEIRPSTLASPRSEKALAFFSCNSVLSNHFPSHFVIENQEFSSMEQFLAVRKAYISERPPMIQKAIQSTDPKQAKYILNTLKDDHAELWFKEVANIALEGLRAKFNQNTAMRDFLTETKDLQLGEASTNSRWAIGMTLDDPDILDTSKWNPEGNLLGKLLMKVREELKHHSQPVIVWMHNV